MSYNIRACKGSARFSCSIFSRSELKWHYWWTCCFGKGRGSTVSASQSQCTGTANQSQHISFFGRRAFIKLGTNRVICAGWGERFCNNVNSVKNNAIFGPPSMRACSSTPPKQNQDFVKEHNRTPLNNDSSLVIVAYQWRNFRISPVSACRNYGNTQTQILQYS